jgi:signal transduction histidine kinase
MKQILSRILLSLPWNFTLRARLTLGMVALLVVYSLVLVVALHITGDVRVSNAPIIIVEADGSPTRYFGLTYEATINDVRGAALRALLVLALVGGVGTFWLVGHMLRPLHTFTDTLEQISAGTLDTRLPATTGTSEIQSLTSSFNRMLARLETAFAQQGRFVADAAHELRTPLATLRTTLETQPPPADMTPTDYHDLAQTFDRTLTRLEALVNHLLVLAVDDRPATNEPIVLGALLEAVQHDLAPLAAAQQVHIEITGMTDLVVVGDAPLLGLVLANLIDNAIRYNRPGGRVVVQLARSHYQARISVTDTGIGIAPEDQLYIFERFYRVDQSRARHRGGAGLGLALVAHIARQHGGMVDVTSMPGVGSTFTLTLPCVAQADADASIRMPAEALQRGS